VSGRSYNPDMSEFTPRMRTLLLGWVFFTVEEASGQGINPEELINSITTELNLGKGVPGLREAFREDVHVVPVLNAVLARWPGKNAAQLQAVLEFFRSDWQVNGPGTALMKRRSPYPEKRDGRE
jgi:hypothetical protein